MAGLFVIQIYTGRLKAVLLTAVLQVIGVLPVIWEGCRILLSLMRST